MKKQQHKSKVVPDLYSIHLPSLFDLIQATYSKMPSIYNPEGHRHVRRNRIIKTIKAVAQKLNYDGNTKGWHVLFNNYANEHQRDGAFIYTRDPSGYTRPSTIEEQVTLWTTLYLTTN